MSFSFGPNRPFRFSIFGTWTYEYRDFARTRNGFSLVNKRLLLARIIRAAQPISRTEIAERIAIDRSTVTEYVKPLIDAGVLTERTLETKVNGRRQRVLGFAEDSGYFIGVNIGVRHTQIGITTLAGEP